MSEMNALQALIYARLTTNAPLVALVGTRVYDRPPVNAAMPYLSFGASDYRIEDFDCIATRVETIQIDCWSTAADGMREAKAMVDAAKKALHDYAGALNVGALISLRVVLARVFADPDGVTTHGFVQVEAVIEEVV